MGDKKKLTEAEEAQKFKQEKKRKKQQKELAQKLKKQKEQQAIADQKVKLIYQSGLNDAYKYFITEAFKEDVKFNIFEYAAQKILKFQKIRKEKNKKISEIQKDIEKKQLQRSVSQQKVTQISSQKKPPKPDASKEKKKLPQPIPS